MTMTKPLIAVCVGFLIAACGGTGSPTPGDKLYAAVAMNHGRYLSVIDSHSHKMERRMPLGVPTSDWKHLYSLVDTSIVDTDPQTGATLRTLQLGHAYRMPDATASGLPGGASPNGRWLVVERYDQAGNEMPSATHLLLITTSPLRVAGRVDLQGFFNFDAISNDGMRLYLVEYLNGKEYFVRLYNVAAGSLEPAPVVDKTDGGEAMSGIRLGGIASKDGSWLLSMYVREHASPFIHALNLDAPFALCLDIRGNGYADDDKAVQWSLAMSSDGESLYAVNPGTGDVAVAVVRDGGWQLVRNARLAVTASASALVKSVDAKEFGANAAVVADQGKTLVVAGPSGVMWIDTATFAVRHRALESWRVWSLGLSPDAESVYAISDSGAVAELSMATGDVGERFDIGGGLPMGLLRVAAA